MHDENLKRGALFMIAAGALFAGMSTIVKIVSTALSNEMVVFFRSAIGLLALLPWMWHRSHSLKTQYLKFHLVRTLAGLSAMYCYFYAVAHLPLAEAMLFNYSMPLFVPFIALIWLGEAIPTNLWWAISVGFSGIVLMLKPGANLIAPAAIIGLASGVLGAMAMVGVRRLTRVEPVSRIVFYFTLIATVISAVPLIWAWETATPSLWGLLVLMGLFASVAQLLMTRAYAHAPAAQVGPFAYTTVIFAATADWLFWGVVIDSWSLFGAGLVCLGGILTIRLAGKKVAPVPELPAEPPSR